MKKYGVNSILSERLLPKKDKIRDSLLAYYEQTEEYEKCMFVKGFFEELEKEIESKEFFKTTGATGESVVQ
jgi:hypothetical protein